MVHDLLTNPVCLPLGYIKTNIYNSELCMKRMLFIFLVACPFHSYAACDESWKKADYEQNIHSYKVINKTFFHSTPDDNSKNNKLFLISNDTFVGF